MFDEITTGLDTDNVSRRRLCTVLGGTVAALAATSMMPASAAGFLSKDAAKPVALDILPNDQDILIFALNLEYLEAEFYSVVTTGKYLDWRDTVGMNDEKGRDTRGGKKVDFSTPALADLAHELANDELNHVRFLRGALEDKVISKPEINLDALGIGFASEQEFLTLARAFEDVGASAYRGAAALINSQFIRDAAAGILTTEAYHGGCLRAHVIAGGFEVPRLDRHDQPPTMMNFFPTDKNGLAVGRLPMDVSRIVRGPNPDGGAFFPKGLTGKIGRLK